MIVIQIPEVELYDENRNEFLTIPKTELRMEHSLVAIRDWEAKWKVPFLSTEKDGEQILDYLRCMTLTENVDPMVYHVIPEVEMKRISEYIKDKKTAMTINKSLNRPGKRNSELVTAETVYWWMVNLGVPLEFENRHLEQLLALIRFISIKNDPNKKKMSQKEIIQRNADLNRRNRERFGVK